MLSYHALMQKRAFENDRNISRKTRELFDRELERRGFAFRIDPETGRHLIEFASGQVLVNLENLQRDVASDGDTGRVSRFLDSIVASSSGMGLQLSANNLFWCLEPNDYEEPAPFRVPLSAEIDRVLVHLASDGSVVTWVTPTMLNDLGLNPLSAADCAFSNLSRELKTGAIESENIDGVQLGFISSLIPFKASLILAPNLREITESVFGWPLMAVCPDRDFLYFWGAKHADFFYRVANVVVREYRQASYPISTEVYEISDGGIRAIGKFPTDE